MYDEIKPSDCKSLEDGVIFVYDCSPEIYSYESIDKVRKDLEGEYKSKEYINAKIFIGALALTYRVNPKELFDCFFNWGFCQIF